jgi:hypothetical protein
MILLHGISKKFAFGRYSAFFRQKDLSEIAPRPQSKTGPMAAATGPVVREEIRSCLTHFH